MLRNSYGKLSGGSRSNTSRAIASDRSREPPAVARSLPLGSIVTPNRLHCAAHSRFQGSLAAPPNGAIRPVQPQPIAHVTRSGRQCDRHRLAVPVGRDRRADLAAARADDAERQPVVGVLDVGHAAVDVAHDGGPVEGGPDERVHLPGRVDVAHPVVAVGVDAEPGEHVDERLGVVAGVRRVAVAGLVRDVGQRRAHVAVDRIGRQQRLGVHRVDVVDAVEERRLEAAGAQGAGDDVEDDRPAEAADVDGAGRGLGVVDDLRAFDARGEFVRPVHARAPLPAVRGRLASRGLRRRRSRLGARGLVLADLDDRVREVAGGDLDDDLLALALPRRARPTGDSLEMRPWAGFASADPTIRNVSARRRR